MGEVLSGLVLGWAARPVRMFLYFAVVTAVETKWVASSVGAGRS